MVADNNTNGSAAGTELPSIQSSRLAGHDSKYPHLRAEVVPLLEAPVIARCRHIMDDRFIVHEHAKVVLGALKDVLEQPKGVRPPCLTIIGGSGVGKSATIKRFLGDYSADIRDADARDHGQMRIVKVEIRARATEPRICLAIASALGLAGYGTTKSRVLQENVYRALEAKGVEMIIFNEAQHIGHLPRLEHAASCDLLKCISNIGVSVVAVGTPSLSAALSQDEQISSRFRQIQLQGFKNDDHLASFLSTLATFYPLPKQSEMNAPRIVKEVFLRTGGNTSEVVRLCNAAAMMAVKTARPCIDLELLRETNVLPPTRDTAEMK